MKSVCDNECDWESLQLTNSWLAGIRNGLSWKHKELHIAIKQNKALLMVHVVVGGRSQPLALKCVLRNAVIIYSTNIQFKNALNS